MVWYLHFTYHFLSGLSLVCCAEGVQSAFSSSSGYDSVCRCKSDVFGEEVSSGSSYVPILDWNQHFKKWFLLW